MKSRDEVVSIQYLRALAASMVVCWHAQMMIPGYFAKFSATVGNAGVDLFFCISGFVMVYVTAEKLRTARQFLTARIVRIVPLYWFYTLATAGLLAVASNLFHSNELSLRHVVLSLLFIPHLAGVPEPSIQPLLKVGWTLIYEMFFYGVFATAIAISRTRRVHITVGVLIAIVIMKLVLTPGTPSANAANPALFFLEFLGQPIVLEFVFGMLIATLYLSARQYRLSPHAGVALIATACVAMFASEYVLKGHFERAVGWGIPAAVILVCAILLEREGRIPQWKFLRLLGDSSYSLYLVHMFPLACLRAVWPKLHVPTDSYVWGVVFILIGISLAALAGIVSYKLLERPMTRYSKRLVDRLVYRVPYSAAGAASDSAKVP